MADFTSRTFEKLLQSFMKAGYAFQTVESFMDGPKKGMVAILRHDVDRLPENAFDVAQMESRYGIHASFYFRMVKPAYDEAVIKKTAALGHEIGYHYENLSRFSGRYELAIQDFEKNLGKLRRFYPVRTVCMHGSPLCGYDNRKIWNRYDYRDYGIIAEPYFDVDFNSVFYLSDTGRSWNHFSASFRDKVDSTFDIPVKSSNDLMDKIQNRELPNKVMINTHPQRWSDCPVRWGTELVVQSVKNVAKRVVLRF
ncbi:MAG: hypothetical protein R6V54_14110 [Desulfobacteraceae bacterium]